MNYGRFFSLNKQKSDIVNGIIFFDYRKIEIKNHVEIDSVQFPIYLYISQNYINFEVHISKGKEEESHAHFSLFQIPLDENEIKETSFTDMLESAYSAFSKREKEDDLFKLPYTHKSTEKDDNSYSALHVFEETQETNTKKKIEKVDNKSQSFYLLRELLLDFIFDLDQKGSIFNISPNSIALLSKICMNPLLNAIIKKARYYYYQKEYTKHIQDLEKEKEIYLSLLTQKAKDWNNLIRLEESEFLFHNSKWCRDVEPEMINMFNEKKCNSKLFLKYKEEWDEMWNVSLNWLLKRLSFKNAIIMFFIPTENNHPEITLLIKSLFNIGIPLFLFTIFTLMLLDHFLLFSLIVLLPFLPVINNSIKRSSVLNLMLPRLWATIVSTWIVLMCNTEILKTFCDLEMDGRIILFQIAIIVLILLFFRAETKKTNPFLPYWNRIVSSCWIIILGLIYSLVTGVVLSSFASDKILANSSFLKGLLNKNIVEESIIEMNDCYSYLGETFYFDCISPEYKESYRKRCEHIINQDSSLIDTLVLKSGLAVQKIDLDFLDKKWNYFLSKDVNQYRLMFLICLDIIDGKDGFKNYKPNYNYKYSELQSLFLFRKLMERNLTSSSYFNSLKYFSFKNSCINRQLFVEKQFCGVYIRYFPVFLVFFSCISMFIGVFLQTILENKKITDAI